MKARYTSFPDKRTKDIYEREVRSMQKDFAVLYEKLCIYNMYMELGFGVKRITAFFDKMGDSVDRMREDPAFWDKVDRTVIDKLGFDYPRCDCEFMEKTFYRPPEISEKEKKQALSQMAKMKQFLSDTGAGT